MRFAAPAIVAIVALLTACGSTDEAAPTVPLTASPSVASATPIAVPSGVPTELPTPPGVESRTQQSANQFATYVALLVNRAVNSRDTAPLFALVAPGEKCAGCLKAKRQLETGSQKLYGIPRTGPKVLGVVPTSAHGDDYVVGVAYQTPLVKIVDASGKVLGTAKPNPNVTVTVTMHWDDASSSWRLKDYQVQAGDEG